MEYKNDSIYFDKNGKREKASNNINRLIIMPEKFSVMNKTSEIETVYDIKNSTITTIYHKDKAFSSFSMFALTETKKRILKAQLQLGTENTQINDLIFREFILESLFGLKEKKSIPKNIKENRKGSVYQFIFSGSDVTSFTPSKIFIPEELKNSFRLYLTYEYNIHPDIINIIVRKIRSFPDNLSYKWVMKYEINNILSLKKIKEYTKDDIYIPANYKEKYSDKEWLNNAIEKAYRDYKEPTIEREKYYIDMFELLDKGKIIDASLAHLAGYYHDGSSPSYPYEVGEKFDNNKQSQILKKALSPKSKEDRKKSIIILKEWPRHDLKYGYMLDAFIGGFYKDLGNYDESNKYFAKALAKNPFLTTIYLGIMSNTGSAITMDGFKCFDVAKKIAPNHPMLQSMKEYEAKFREEYSSHF